MKHPKYLITAVLFIAIGLQAQTTMQNSGNPTDTSLWSNGLPNIGNDGTIGSGITATYDSGNITALTGTGGTGGQVARLTVNGGTLTKTGTGNLIFGSNAQLILNGGIVENPDGDIRFNRSSAIINAGSLYSSGSIVLFGTQSDQTTQGQFVMKGGSVDVNSFIMNQSGVVKSLLIEGGLLNIRGRLDMSATDNQYMLFAGNKGGQVIIGATGITYGNSFVNFEADSLGSLTIAGYDTTKFELDYNAGYIRFNGTNTTAFSDVFSVSGTTLSLTSIPEPAHVGVALGALACLALLCRSRFTTGK